MRESMQCLSFCFWVTVLSVILSWSTHLLPKFIHALNFLNDWIVFHIVFVPHFQCPFVTWRSFRLFWFVAIVSYMGVACICGVGHWVFWAYAKEWKSCVMCYSYLTWGFVYLITDSPCWYSQWLHFSLWVFVPNASLVYVAAGWVLCSILPSLWELEVSCLTYGWILPSSAFIYSLHVLYSYGLMDNISIFPV